MMDSKKTLLFQAHTSNLLGGAEYSLLALLKDSVKRGYKTHVIVPGKGPFVDAANNTGAVVHVVKSYWWTTNGRNERHPKRNLAAIKKTNEIIRSISPALCITNTITTPWLAYCAYENNVSHLWILREYGDTDHGLKFWVSKEEICKMVGELSQKIFANSKVLRQHYKELTGHKDIGIINPHVEKPIVTSKSDPFKEGTLKLVCVGNLSEGKGQLDAVKAVKILRDKGLNPQLFILGATAELNYESKIRKYIESEKLDDFITLLGYIKNPANYVAYADFNLVCSRTETFGRITIESLLQGVPVIGTNSANTSQLLKNKKEILYEFGNSDQLAEKIQNLHKYPKNKIDVIINDLKSTIKELYSPNKVHKDFFNFVSKLKIKEDGKKPSNTYKPLFELLNRQKQIGLTEMMHRKAIFKIKNLTSRD